MLCNGDLLGLHSQPCTPRLVPARRGRWRATPGAPSVSHSTGTCRVGHRSDTIRAGPAEQGHPTLLPHPGSQGQGPDLDSEGTQSRGTCYHLSSAWDPRSPLLLLVFLRLVYHREAPAAEKEQVGSLDNPERPHSPAAWTRAGGRAQGLRQAQHTPASVSSSHSPPHQPPRALAPYPPETSRHIQGLRGECQKPKSSDCN